MVARHVVEHEAEAEQAVIRHIVIKCGIAVIHEEVLIDIEIVDGCAEVALLLCLAVSKAQEIAVRVGFRAAIHISIMVVIFVRLVRIRVMDELARKAELADERRLAIHADIAVRLLRAEVDARHRIAPKMMLVIDELQEARLRLLVLGEIILRVAAIADEQRIARRHVVLAREDVQAALANPEAFADCRRLDAALR